MLGEFINFNYVYALGGGMVGLLVGMTGVGGGSLMTPLLVNFFHVNPLTAVGTDLAFAAVTKTFGTIFHKKQDNVQWQIVRLLMIGSIPAALLSIVGIKWLGQVTPNHQGWIKQIIGWCVLLTVVSMFFRERLVHWMMAHPQWQLQGPALGLTTISLGAMIGILVTTSSIGAGAVGATAIMMLYPALKPAEVAGTDIAYAVPLTIVAGLGHIWLGNFDFRLLLSLLVGSVPGIYVGSHLASRLPELWVRIVLGAVMASVAFKMLS